MSFLKHFMISFSLLLLSHSLISSFLTMRSGKADHRCSHPSSHCFLTYLLSLSFLTFILFCCSFSLFFYIFFVSYFSFMREDDSHIPKLHCFFSSLNLQSSIHLFVSRVPSRLPSSSATTQLPAVNSPSTSSFFAPSLLSPFYYQCNTRRICFRTRHDHFYKNIFLLIN